MTLREQVTQILYQADQEHDTALYPNSGMASETLDQSGERDAYEHQADAVMAVFAERERLLRERIRALAEKDGGVDYVLDEVLAVFDD